MRLLFIGDIVGEAGLQALRQHLPGIKRQYKPQVTIANGENVTQGRGISEKHYKDLLQQGVDVITLGNHAFDQRQLFDYIHQAHCLVRPLNLPEATPGQGVHYLKVNEVELAVVNVLGNAFMAASVLPFPNLKDQIQAIRDRTPNILIDFHGESTSEKQAFAYWLDGQVSAVVGTHTHVQTHDERILPQKTAFISDVGMTGAWDSIIGFQVETVLKRFTSQLPTRLEVAKTKPLVLNAVVIEVDQATGRAKRIDLVREIG